MAYSGRYQVKNPKKYLGDPSAVVYRSLWERAAFQWCDANPAVKGWSSEEVVIPYYYDVDKKYHRYFVDLKIVMKEKTILVEIKPDNNSSIIFLSKFFLIVSCCILLSFKKSIKS